MSIKSYLQRPFQYSYSNVTIALIILNTGLFIIDNYLLKNGMRALFALNPMAVLKNGYIWQVFTYMFMHGSFQHVFFNMLGLFFFGIPLERRIGSKEFLLFYLLTGVLTGIISLVVLGGRPTYVLGASGAIYGVLLAYATFFPDARILVFFVLPLRAPVAVLLFAGISLVMHLTNPFSGVAHYAHLAGIVIGFFYFIVRFNINPIKVFFKR